MEQSLPKTTLENLDPYPKRCRMESSDNICSRNTRRRPPSSCVQQDTPNNYYLSDRSIRKRWSTSSLDDEIKILLHEKLVRRVVGGRPSETIQFHRRRLIKELADWIGVFEEDDLVKEENENGCFRDRLVSLLATASKQNLKDMPLDNSEWIKLLNQWIKSNSSGAVISTREIYKILAVDGFRGFKPKHLKLYLSGVLLPSRAEYKTHASGIRCMYEFFDKNKDVSGLTGTDSACVVFIALVEWYAHKMKDDLMLDDQMTLQVQRVKSWAEGYLQQHAEYYRDIRNVDENVLKEFGNIYAKQFQDGDAWKALGRELFQSLNHEDF